MANLNSIPELIANGNTGDTYTDQTGTVEKQSDGSIKRIVNNVSEVHQVFYVNNETTFNEMNTQSDSLYFIGEE